MSTDYADFTGGQQGEDTPGTVRQHRHRARRTSSRPSDPTHGINVEAIPIVGSADWFRMLSVIRAQGFRMQIGTRLAACGRLSGFNA